MDVITQPTHDGWKPPVPDDRLVDAIDRLARAGVSITTRALADGGPAADLTLPQWRALVVVAEAGIGGVRVGTLGRRLGLAAPGASRLARRLEARGMIIVRRDEPDRRAAVLRATDAGRGLWTTVVLRRRTMIARVLASLEAAAPAAIDEYLAAVASALLVEPGESPAEPPDPTRGPRADAARRRRP